MLGTRAKITLRAGSQQPGRHLSAVKWNARPKKKSKRVDEFFSGTLLNPASHNQLHFAGKELLLSRAVSVLKIDRILDSILESWGSGGVVMPTSLQIALDGASM